MLFPRSKGCRVLAATTPSSPLPAYPVSGSVFMSSSLSSSRRLRPSRRTTTACLLLLAAACLDGCTQKEAKPASGKGGRGAGGPVPVVTDKVIKKDAPLSIDAIGAVESQRSISIKSLVTGMLMKVNFQEGQEVKAGDLLFEIDPRPFQNALRSAEADIAKTKALLENADAETARYSSLLKENMVSKEQFQNVQNNQHTLKASLASGEAAIANAALQLEYCSIHAPCDGRTGSLGAHEGDLVRASDANISLVTLTQLAPIYVSFSLPQQHLPLLQKYRSAGKIGVRAAIAGADAPEKGELTFLDNGIDAATGTIRLKATFANEDHGLWPGLFVNVKLTLTVLRDQLLVPTASIQNGQRGQQVFVVTDKNEKKTVELRDVVVDRAIGDNSVISKGLKEGEMVV